MFEYEAGGGGPRRDVATERDTTCARIEFLLDPQREPSSESYGEQGLPASSANDPLKLPYISPMASLWLEFLGYTNEWTKIHLPYIQFIGYAILI